ncbi:MAG: hypothetical protein M1825_005887 [Sarcosagium campestre]|nr:MAG: hypothetical protein M1825_005887 [Sarcosagium campestre]
MSSMPYILLRMAIKSSFGRIVILACITAGFIIAASWRIGSTRNPHHSPLPTTVGQLPMGQDEIVNPALHFLLHAPRRSSRVCKTLLSSSILGYPPPTLINYGVAKPRTKKLESASIFLQDEKHVAAQDLVLVIDASAAWFQLPATVLLERYDKMIRERQNKTIVFAADKVCWPDKMGTRTCDSVPKSPLRENLWGPKTDKDPGGLMNRPRFLNSGVMMGTAQDVKVVFEEASARFQQQTNRAGNDQSVFSEMFGEQQNEHLPVRKGNGASPNRWKDWMSAKHRAKPSDEVLSWNGKVDQPHEASARNFGIGLDYDMGLFQTIALSRADVEFLSYNDSRALARTMKMHRSRRNFQLPQDILRTTLPLTSVAASGRLSNTTTDDKNFTSKIGMSKINWSTVPLATNVRTALIPAVLHFKGEKANLNDWWPKMWYFPHARALLSSYIHSPGLHPMWDRRGGIGGAWTTSGHWMSWRDLCGGFESEVFGDGKGPWGKETGDGKEWDDWGKLIKDIDVGV